MFGVVHDTWSDQSVIMNQDKSQHADDGKVKKDAKIWALMTLLMLSSSSSKNGI